MQDAERLKEMLYYLRINPTEFSRSIGMTRPDTLFRILHGDAKISRNLADKIRNVHPEINAAWLLTGAGQMLTGTEQSHPVFTDDCRRKMVELQAKLRVAMEEAEIWRKKYEDELMRGTD